MRSSFLFPLVASAALCACGTGATEGGEPASQGANAPAAETALSEETPIAGTEPPDATNSGDVDDDACGTGRLTRWLNLLPTETVKTEIAEAVGEHPIRYYTQGDPITMDFSASRLNVELGVDGRIKLFRCG